MQLDFMMRGILAGMGIALVAGPLGSFIIWRRMANFGDALAHSALLGLCFSLAWGMNLYLVLIIMSVAVSTLAAIFSRQKRLANDTVLCILAYSSLAMGLLGATLLPGIRVDLLGYLYGDILAVDQTDLIWIFCVDGIVLVTLIKIWKSLLAMTVHEDLAKVEGVPVAALNWTFIILMALVFAVAMKLVGVLLITGLLLIPASAARQISQTPEQMAIFSSILGMLAVYGGMGCSGAWDWPAGPAIVVVALVFLIVCGAASRIFQSCMTRHRKIH